MKLVEDRAHAACVCAGDGHVGCGHAGCASGAIAGRGCAGCGHVEAVATV